MHRDSSSARAKSSPLRYFWFYDLIVTFWHGSHSVAAGADWCRGAIGIPVDLRPRPPTPDPAFPTNIRPMPAGHRDSRYPPAPFPANALSPPRPADRRGPLHTAESGCARAADRKRVVEGKGGEDRGDIGGG